MASYTAVLLSRDGVGEMVIPEVVPYIYLRKTRRLDTLADDRRVVSRLPPRKEYVKDFRRLTVYSLPGQLVFYEEVPS